MRDALMEFSQEYGGGSDKSNRYSMLICHPAFSSRMTFADYGKVSEGMPAIITGPGNP